MVDSDKPDTPKTVPPSGEPRRRREPPTIDLSASASSTRDRPGEATPPDAAGSEAPGGPEAAESTSASAAQDTPQPAIPDTSPDKGAATTSRRSSGIVPALTGAAAAVVVLGGAWLIGWPPAPAPQPQQPVIDTGAVDGLASRLAALEVDVRTVRTATAAAAPAPVLPDDLAARIGAIEQAQTTLRETIETQRGQIEQQATTLATELEKLRGEISSRPSGAGDNTLSSDALKTFETRLASTEQAIRDVVTKSDAQAAQARQTAADIAALNTSLAKQNGSDNAAMRRATLAGLLMSALQQHQPYATLLDAAKEAAPDAAALAPLERFAQTGLPDDHALSAELKALIPALTPAQPAQTAATETGLLARLQASAAKLVHIRRDGPVEGTTSAAVVSRITAAAKQHDITAARRELLTLPAGQRSAADGWLAKLDARDAALKTARDYADQATSAMLKPAR